MIGKFKKGDIIRIDMRRTGRSNDPEDLLHYLTLDANDQRLYTLLCLDDGITYDHFKRDIDKIGTLRA